MERPLARPIRTHRFHESGQTLVVALLILGILLGLGLVFVSIVGRNVNQASRSFTRTVSSDLAEAGIRNVHYMLVHSPQGADYRPAITSLGAGNFSRDPDAAYLRLGSGFLVNATVKDLGGPDGLGPYSRINFDKGRALVRVRYAPADWDNFGTPTGALRKPGKARSYLVIESVGRAGRINLSDPTTQWAQGIQVAGFPDQATFAAAFPKLLQFDAQNAASRKLLGIASLGVTEQARFITNKFRLGQKAEIGSLTGDGTANTDGLGMFYEGKPVNIVSNYGGSVTDPADVAGTQGNPKNISTGSLFSNASLEIHGAQNFYINNDLGDMIAVAGDIDPANQYSSITVTHLSNGVLAKPLTLKGNGLDSHDPAFDTLNGSIRDGRSDTDREGYTRGINRKEPPSIQEVDPTTNTSRYLLLTRDAGTILNGRNLGRFGYGDGIYVNASSGDRTDSQDENERIRLGASKKTPSEEWLNPDKGSARAAGRGWVGNYYVPTATYVHLVPDGFEIIRDATSTDDNSRYWRNQSGRFAGTYCRFRLISLKNGQQDGDVYVINGILSPDLVNQSAATIRGNGNLANRVITEGRPWNGVIYCEGDVRVRGVIPTNQQVSIVSLGTIYIEGSIVKGVTDDTGATIKTPSKSMCALMAKDYITVNTTQFFAPAPSELIWSQPASINRALLLDDNARPVNFITEFPLAPTGVFGTNATNPTNFKPFATTYKEAGSNNAISSNLLIEHASQGNQAYFSLGIGSAGTHSTTTPVSYVFSAYKNSTNPVPNFNDYLYDISGGGTSFPMYGLGRPGQNTNGIFETISIPLLTSAMNSDSQTISAGGTNGQNYKLGVQEPSFLTFKREDYTSALGGEAAATTNYLLRRVAVVPADIRIEATLFAEEGSFFVIPGLPYNDDPQDLRDTFDNDVKNSNLNTAIANRWNNHHHAPEVPFYNEAPNIRITISGSLTENMPAPMAQQASWQRMWGWMPGQLSGTGLKLPTQHVPYVEQSVSTNAGYYAPSLTIAYDPVLAVGSPTNDPANPVRVDSSGIWTLPPLPKLPVSPQLVYFGETNP